MQGQTRKREKIAFIKSDVLACSIRRNKIVSQNVTTERRAHVRVGAFNLLLFCQPIITLNTHLRFFRQPKERCECYYARLDTIMNISLLYVMEILMNECTWHLLRLFARELCLTFSLFEREQKITLDCKKRLFVWIFTFSFFYSK